MNGKSPVAKPVPLAFLAWLAQNPTGIPQRQALLRAVLGAASGLLSGSVTSWLFGLWSIRPLWAIGLGIGSGILSGATLGALGVVLVAYAIDRWVLASEHLIGYSGVIRMLLHAGELSGLGALAGGIGGGAGGLVAGVLVGLFGGSLADGRACDGGDRRRDRRGWRWPRAVVTDCSWVSAGHSSLKNTH
jgi:hypothetical protein